MTYAQAAQMNNQRALAALLAARLQREQSAREAGHPAPLLDRVEGLPTVSGSVVEALGLVDVAPTAQNLQDYTPEEAEIVLDEWRALPR